MPTFNRKQIRRWSFERLVREVAAETGAPLRYTRAIISRYNLLVGQLLSNGQADRVRIEHVGVLAIVRRRGRRCKVPQADAPTEVPPRYAVRFKPSTRVRDALKKRSPK